MKLIHRNNKKGFTLFEMLVSIGIFTALTTVLLMNHGQFKSSVVLDNLAYEIALAVRQAQSYGLNVRAANISTSDYTRAFGVHFYRPSIDDDNFLLFADTSGSNNLRYDGVAERIEQFKLPSGIVILKYCGVVSSTGDETIYCSDTNAAVQYLDITFRRPDPNATFVLGSTVTETFRSVKIYIKSNRTDQQAVIQVDKIGQIAVLD